MTKYFAVTMLFAVSLEICSTAFLISGSMCSNGTLRKPLSAASDGTSIESGT